MPSISSVTWSSERLVVRAISTSDLSISDSSSLSITPLLSLSHMSKMMRSLSSVLPRENSKTVSKNSWNFESLFVYDRQGQKAATTSAVSFDRTWKEIRPSPSLSTMLNIFFTKTASGRMPRALANSLLESEVRITVTTSPVSLSSDRRLRSPGRKPKVNAYASLKN